MKTQAFNSGNDISFENLVAAIQTADRHFSLQAKRAVNSSLTLRNWIIGYYIGEFEKKGVDRAQYGDRLVENLSNSLQEKGLSRCDKRELYRYLLFYKRYPQIVEAVNPQFQIAENQSETKVETASPQFKTEGKKLIERLSFSHLVEILEIEEPLKRYFYEFESIRGNWSVRELEQQCDLN